MEVYPFLCRTFPGAGRRKRGCGRAKPIFMPSPILDLTCYARTNLPGQSPGRMKAGRSEEHTSELQSLMRISYAAFCLKKKRQTEKTNTNSSQRSRTNTRHRVES